MLAAGGAPVKQSRRHARYRLDACFRRKGLPAGLRYASRGWKTAMGVGEKGGIVSSPMRPANEAAAANTPRYRTALFRKRVSVLATLPANRFCTPVWLRLIADHGEYARAKRNSQRRDIFHLAEFISRVVPARKFRWPRKLAGYDTR